MRTMGNDPRRAGAIRLRFVIFRIFCDFPVVPGILSDRENEASVIPTICTDEIGGLIRDGIISGGMLPKIKSWLKKRLPEEKLKPAADALKRMKNAVGGWLTAQLKLMGVTFTILTLGFVVLRIAYAPLWALVVALVDALPVLGTGTVLVPWAVICFLQGEGARAIGLLGVYAVVTLSRSMLEPKLVGRHLGLDPLVTLMALYVGYKLWGVGGMIFAPLLAVTIMQVTPGRERGDTPEIP